MLWFALVPDRPAFDPLWLLLLALLLEPLFGEARGPLRWLPHPVRLIGAMIATLDRLFNRETWSEALRSTLGAVTVLLVCGGAAAFGVLIALASGRLPWAWPIEVVLIIAFLAQRSLYLHVEAVAEALDQRGLAAGREAVARIVGRDVTRLDASGVARAAIESCAENFSDAVVAPTFWYLVFGLPGLAVYKAVNTLDSMIGHRSPRFRAFGWVAARLDDLLNLVPARLAGLFLTAAAAIVPAADGARAAWAVMWRDASRHRSPNAGWPEAAIAGALGVALGGPRRYPGEVVDAPWLGEGLRRNATLDDIRRALRLLVVACGANTLLVALIVITRATWP